MADDGIEYRNITIPDDDFKWFVDKEEIGSVTDDGLFNSKLLEGRSDILVVDQRMPDNTAEGSINVVFPYRIEVRIRDVTDAEKL